METVNQFLYRVTSIQAGPVDTTFKKNIKLHRELLEDERVDAMAKKAFKQMLDWEKSGSLTDGTALSCDGMATLIRDIIEAKFSKSLISDTFTSSYRIASVLGILYSTHK